MNIDVSTLLPLLLQAKGGGEYGDLISLMSGMKKPPKPKVDVNKYFNPDGGPCPPERGCEKPEGIPSELLELLLKKSLCPCSPPPKKPREKPCGFRPIADFCGEETMLMLIRLIYG